VDAVLESLMRRADKELRRARRKHPQFAGEAGFGGENWGEALAWARDHFREKPFEDSILMEEVLEFLTDAQAGRSEEAGVEAAQVVAVLVRMLSEGSCRR